MQVCDSVIRFRCRFQQGRRAWPRGSSRSFFFLASMTVVLGCISVSRAAEDRVDYPTQIKPILRERCYACHGALRQKSGLRLDTVGFVLRGGRSGAVVTPGDASKSLLLHRVSATDAAERMPPEHDGEPLSSEQIALLQTWIQQGAPSPPDEKPEADPRNHWAFRPVARPDVPVVSNRAWPRNPVDAFLAEKHEQHGLAPQPEASRLVLLRRLFLDLIGIPPTAEEISAVETDLSPDWYERLVDRLLDDPRHGERWARHWMDIWRYSDWWGLGGLRNSQKHMWHWRDWIVESLNSDTPYDEMVRLMLAADELHPNDLDKLRATGFLARNFFMFNRNQWMEETVEHVSKGLLGLTMNCAKCHDHKYDPIPQADFYRMRAFFEPYQVRLDVVPGESDLEREGIPRVFDALLDAPTYVLVRGQENHPDKSKLMEPGVPELLAFEELQVLPVVLPVGAWQPERRPWVLDAYRARAGRNAEAVGAALRKAREKLAAAEKREAELLVSDAAAAGAGAPVREDASDALRSARAEVAEAEAELKVSDAAVSLARAERDSVELRADAMRAGWADADAALSEAERQYTDAAIRAERQVLVAKSRHGVAVAELELLRASDAGKKSSGKRLETARKALDEALGSAEAEIQPTDSYSPLPGAKWTTTRFLYAQKDDPRVNFPPQSTGRRTALANWITDRRNPLTARVAVNHIWLRHMGAPLVSTVFDFGRNGARPTHPELVDWLAAEFMDSGWSLKNVHRLIVNSTAYRMRSSAADGEASAAKDPDNRYLWRRVPLRLESQVVRDSILALAGILEPTLGGPSIPRSEQDGSKRRGLYFFHSLTERNAFLTAFDEAMVNECYRRDVSIQPQQALAMTNSKIVLEAAPFISRRLSKGMPDDFSFIRKAFAVLLGFAASDRELEASNAALESWRQLSEGSSDDARAHLVWALLNHNDFVTVR